MLLPWLLTAGLVAGGQTHIDPALVYNGRANALDVRPPRREVEVVIDGTLDEAVWGEAARLTGFSQFAPSDGVAASDSTEVLVWYSPTAMYFGIRAYEAHGSVHATLADRDRIGSDDNVQLFLSTFNDGRQATVLAVNPFGVQSDGVLVESGRNSSGLAGGIMAREDPDLSPDFVFQSKGRVTPQGYEVEIRVPFKSLRYAAGREHIWGFNAVRSVQHSGYQDSWTPARRASVSFLGQSGRLSGLTDLRRGVVVDLTPELTSKVSGAPLPGGAGWSYDGGKPEIGGTVRWGVTNNLTLNGTANPDFSQVESDAGQLAFDPRQALFFSEKRPFFLDGIEQFRVPNNLIYTRRIVQPVAAVKLTGKAVGTDVGFLSAVDDRGSSLTGDDHPVYNILRAQRDIGRQSRIGFAYTDRVDGGDYNRMADIDGRILFGGVYSAQFQVAGSRTREGGETRTAPLWQLRLDRNGKTFGWRTTFYGIGDQFRAGSGFVNRPGIVQAFVNPSLTFYPRGGAIERFTTDIALDGTWQYQHFVHGRGIQDQKLHINGRAALKGGWDLQGGVFIESFGYDSLLFADYYLQVPRAGGGLDTIPFTGQPTIPNFEGFVQVNTPQFQRFDANIFALYGHDENFFEWSSSKLLIMNAGVNWRPTDKLRLGLTYNWQLVIRRTDGTTVGQGRIPRLKVEYQLARPLFVRIVGQYVAIVQDSLRDDSRTEAPILIRDPGSGSFSRAGATQTNSFRGDVLLSYQPSPGTVLFAGYGSTLDDTRAFRFSDLRRTDDGFFLKLSYLFRM